jgi:hypothetical protein
MLRFSINFVVNRLILIGAILMFLNSYVRDNCYRGASYFGTIEYALDGWRELQRALE